MVEYLKCGSRLGGDLSRLCSNEGLSSEDGLQDAHGQRTTECTKHHQTGVESVAACCVRDGERESSTYKKKRERASVE